MLYVGRISQQQYKASGSLVLYHFVGSSTSSSSDPTLMIRRLTAQVRASILSNSKNVKIVEVLPLIDSKAPLTLITNAVTNKSQSMLL